VNLPGMKIAGSAFTRLAIGAKKSSLVAMAFPPVRAAARSGSTVKDGMLISVAMLADSAYGKSGIRLVKVTRRGGFHDIRDLTVAVRFQGDYVESYTEGDNTDVLPTDTMKNTVYALAAAPDFGEPEPFGLKLADHFMDRNERLDRVTITIIEHHWRRLSSDGREHADAFMRRGPEKRTATVKVSRDDTRISAGIDDLLVLKSGKSAFTGFPRDEYTTLPETTDRILATSMTASWLYASADVDFKSVFEAVRARLLDEFARHNSLSVQHTLYAMAQDVIDHVKDITAVRLVMPNKHHLPVDLSKLGLENKNEIFVATEEPFGLIEASVTRG
jgi:urate oxidase